MVSSRPVALVSGGSRGLGAAVVKRLLDDGYVVATYSRSSSPFVEELRGRDAEAASFYWEAVDGADLSSLERFVKTVAKRYGRCDALVNNAAILTEGLLALSRPADVHDVLRINLEAPILLTRSVCRIMIQRESGSIVNISSLNGIRGFRGVGAYAASKAGLDGFTRSLARELGPAGIRVNSVAPGYFLSAMAEGFAEKHAESVRKRTPLGRLGEANDIASVVHFLLSPHAGFITGQTIVVDGGYTC
jgi:3-oxoacyl-[acyl-carrier protein] reductase